MKVQREEWNAIEAKGEVVKAWQPKKSQKPKQSGENASKALVKEESVKTAIKEESVNGTIPIKRKN